METPNAFAASPMATIVPIMDIIALVWIDVKRTVPTLRAPHGGLFVFPVVGHWGWYLIALAAGSVLSMFLLAVLKKDLRRA
jgi:fructose-specific phosphotransferase system IIC component